MCESGKHTSERVQQSVSKVTEQDYSLGIAFAP